MTLLISDMPRSIVQSEHKCEDDQNLLNCLPHMIWTTHPDGSNESFNRSWRDYIGTESGESIQDNWLHWVHPEDFDKALSHWNQAFVSGCSFNETCRLRGKSGEYFWFLVQARTQRNETREIIRWVGSCTDIHEQHLQYLASEESARIQRQMLDASIDCIKVIHPDGHLSTMNRAGCVALGVSEDSDFGMEWLPLLPVEIHRPGEDALSLARKGENARFPGKSQLPGQEAQYWDNILTPLKDPDGRVTTILCVSREVTLTRKAEEALIRSEKLAAAGRLAASVSHEINNPLAAVTNLLYLAEKDNTLSQETRDYLASAQEELARVSQIAIQTLQFYRQSTKASKVVLENQLDAILGFYRGRLHSGAVTVQKRYRHHAAIVAYEGELRQVFTNLIGNAIDALRMSGQLSVRTRLLSKEIFGNEYVAVTIADTGTGMSPAVLSKSFEPFFTTKGITATGLGLWVSKSILEKHGGFIRVRSRELDASHGSVFMVWIPLMPIENGTASLGSTPTTLSDTLSNPV